MQYRKRCSRALLVTTDVRSEEHTSELQSQSNLVCRLLLEKKNKTEDSRPRPAATLRRQNARLPDLTPTISSTTPRPRAASNRLTHLAPRDPRPFLHCSLAT